MTKTDAAQNVVTPWHLRDPQRWRRELTELDATGWQYRVTRPRGGVGLVVHAPIEGHNLVRLRVRFRETYPWFAPQVTDIDAALTGARHLNPGTQNLCLLHDWHVDMTVAELLTRQLPLWAEADRAKGSVKPRPGVEVPVAEPLAIAASPSVHTIVIPTLDAPTDLSQGAVLARFGTFGDRLGNGLLTDLYAEGLHVTCDIPRQNLGLPLPITGRWLRDPEYKAGETPAATWKRVAPRLRPISELVGQERANSLNENKHPDMELVALLVPDEVNYRQSGESWVVLLRAKVGSPGARKRTLLLRTQYLSRALLSERAPAFAGLADKSVAVFGLGSVGYEVALDLAMSGVGRLLLMDRDIGDVATGCRQQAGAAVHLAGEPKATVAQVLINRTAPYCRVSAVHGDVEGLWESQSATETHLKLLRRLANVDLLIDCCADLGVSRFLSAVAAQSGTPYLHASATAGAHGGVVTLLKPGDGCWACVEHHRADDTLPIPAVDSQAGWVAPTRSCNETFTGLRSGLLQISAHASATAIAHLTGGPLAANYFAARLVDRGGFPTPITWQAANIAVHPDCRGLHRLASTDPGGDLREAAAPAGSQEVA